MMEIIPLEKIPQLVIFLVLFITGYYYIYLGTKGKSVPSIRKIAAIDAIDECVGRAVEMGRPVWFDPLYNVVKGGYAPQTYAAYSILSHVARQTARYDVPLITTSWLNDAITLQTETVRSAYLAEGKGDQFSLDMIEYRPDISGIIGVVAREKPACAIAIGHAMSQVIQKLETAQNVGATTISGTATSWNIPAIFMAADYVLISEELYAAGAFLSKDPAQVGSLVSEDIGKIIGIVGILLGAVAMTFGSDIILKLFTGV
jgi:hypothetical protein